MSTATPIPTSSTPNPPTGPLPEQDQATHSRMPLQDHLGELRNRLIIAVVSVVVGMTAAFMGALPIIEILKHVAPRTIEFVQLTPGEVLMCAVKVSVFGGIALASPILLYQISRFVLPGLRPQEKAMLGWVITGGTVLFLMGVAFAYYTVVPSALTFLLDYGQHVAKSYLSLAKHVDFCLSLLVLTGILFELPLVLYALAMLRIISSQKLIAHWREAIVGVIVIAAVVTPSQDPLTMALVAGAMLGLYFVSIIPIKLSGR